MFGESRSKPIIDGKILITKDNLLEVNDTIWQKLRNDEVNLEVLENLCEHDAYQALNSKVKVELKRKRWICRNCKKATSASKLTLCDCCLDWLHLRCVGLSSAPKKDMWYCPDCQESNQLS